jgi:hypothetical protein
MARTEIARLPTLMAPRRLLEEGPVPASTFQAPRPDEDPSFHHHGPDADEAILIAARPDGQHLFVANAGQNAFAETAPEVHPRAQPTAGTQWREVE